MKFGAYVLVADPTWIKETVRSYYNQIDVLVLSFDVTSTGYTGADIPVDRCLADFHSIDLSLKIVRLPGDYSAIPGSPMERETKQRQDCIDYLSDHVDWILQLDNDEFLPNVDKLLEIAATSSAEISGIEWPMRVLYRHLGNERFLAIAANNGLPVYEYPGAVIVRRDTRLSHARNVAGIVIRCSVHNDNLSLQLRNRNLPGIHVIEQLGHEEAILHNSWGRSPSNVLSKVRTWSHSNGIKSMLYFVFVWYPSILVWPILRNFHPFAKGLWPRLCILDVKVGSHK